MDTQVSESLKPTYIFLDIETTGLDPTKHGIVQVGAYATGSTEDDVLDYFVEYANPGDVIFDQQAMDVHKIPRQVIDKARPIQEVLKRFDAWATQLMPIDSATIVNHGAKFDTPFMEIAYRKAGLSTNPRFRRVLCTQSLGWFVLRLDKPPSLSTLCERLGISTRGKRHDALMDAVVTGKAFHKIMAARPVDPDLLFR